MADEHSAVNVFDCGISMFEAVAAAAVAIKCSDRDLNKAWTSLHLIIEENHLQVQKETGDPPEAWQQPGGVAPNHNEPRERPQRPEVQTVSTSTTVRAAAPRAVQGLPICHQGRGDIQRR